MITIHYSRQRNYEIDSFRWNDFVAKAAIRLDWYRAFGVGNSLGAYNCPQDDSLSFGDLAGKGPQLLLVGMPPKNCEFAGWQRELGAGIWACKHNDALYSLQILASASL